MNLSDITNQISSKATSFRNDIDQTFASIPSSISKATDKARELLTDATQSAKSTIASAASSVSVPAPIELKSRTQTNLSTRSWPSDVTKTPYLEIHIVIREDSIAMKQDQSEKVALVNDTALGKVGAPIIEELGGWLGKQVEGISSGVKYITDEVSQGLDYIQGNAKSIVKNEQNTTTTENATAKLSANPLKMFSQTRYRLKDSIVLPMPGSISSSLGISWKDSKLSSEGAALFDPAVAQNMANMKEGKINEIVKTVAAQAVKTGAAAIGINKDLISKGSSSITNPFVSTLFDSLNLRQFDFSWTIAPRNRNEALSIMEIIKALRYHSSPEFTGELRTFMRYPSEFELAFKMGSERNSGEDISSLPKLKRCVCTKVDVVYGKGSKWGYFEDPRSGHLANNITLHVSFTEIIAITKEDIMQGY